MKRFFSVVLGAVCLMSAASCSGASAGKDRDEPVKAPQYASVDESGYTVYYFDGERGDDGNSGLSEGAPKKSLACMTELVASLQTPAKILLKAGTVFHGSLTLRDYFATTEQPLVIDRYGSQTELPRIVSDAEQAVHVLGENVRIYHLEITNKTGLRGICVETAKDGASSNFVVEGCEIHDVQWNWTFAESVEEAASRIGNYDVRSVCPDENFAYSTSGIYFTAPAKEGDKPRWFENVWISRNKISKVGRAGIITYSEWVVGNGCQWVGMNRFKSQDDGWYPPKNVVISGNDVRYVGGDAIVTIGAEDCWMEYNNSYHAALLGRYPFACAGIWPVNARRVYMQYNEASFTHLDNGCTDGEGFDIDVGCSDVIFQYNYAHDNAGGGLLICNTHAVIPVYDENGEPVTDPVTGEVQTFVSAGNWNNVRIRNNVFACNGRSGVNGAFLVMSSDCKNAVCENNLVVLEPGLQSQHLITSADYGKCGRQENLVCRNNIFYASEPQHTTIQLDYCASSTFENNLYYNFPESFFDEWTGISDPRAVLTVNPLIEIPEDRTGYEKLTLFRPRETAVFSLGAAQSVWCKYDAAGTETKNQKYLGAFCS